MLISSLFIASLHADDITSFVGGVELGVSNEVVDEVVELSSDEVLSFEETPVVQEVEESFDIEEIPLAETISVTEPKSVISKKEPVIIDDLHDIPTVIKMSDYRAGTSKKAVVKKAPKVSNFTGKNTKIVKYINPQMRKLNLSIP
jgi:hypothetical protein